MDLFTLLGRIKIESGDSNDEIDNMIGKAQTLSDTLNGTSKDATNASNGITSSVKTSTSKLNAWSVALGNIYTKIGSFAWDKGKDFFQVGYEFNKNMDLWRSQLQNMLNLDFEEADEFLNKLHRFAIDTPYTMEEVMSNSIMLLGNRKIRETTDIIDLLTIIGNMSNGDNSSFSSIARGIMQVMTKGKVQAEEANQQFAERGVDVWQIIADYFTAIDRDGQTDWMAGDVSSLALIDPETMATAEEFMAALEMAALQEGGFYSGRMDAMMDTASGQAQKLQDNYEQTAGAFVKAFFDVFNSDTINALNNSLDKLYSWSTEHPDALKNLAEGFSALATNGIDLLVTSLTGLIEFYETNKAMFDTLLVTLGGILMSTGHPLSGAALITAAGFDVWAEGQRIMEEEGFQNAYPNNPAIQEAIESGATDDLTGWDKFVYEFDKALTPFGLWVSNLFPNSYVDPELLGPEIIVTDDGGGFRFGEPANGTDLPSPSGSNSIGELIAAIRTQNERIEAAVQNGVISGFSGVTITGNVTTGNVTLNNGALVGALAPQLNLRLGWENKISGRDSG